MSGETEKAYTANFTWYMFFSCFVAGTGFRLVITFSNFPMAFKILGIKWAASISTFSAQLFRRSVLMQPAEALSLDGCVVAGHPQSDSFASLNVLVMQ